jgi:hypothetical protein
MIKYIVENMKIKGLIAFVLILNMICTMMLIPEGYIANAAANYDWLSVEGGSNGIQETISIYDDTIVQEGKHVAADDDVTRYKTTGYYMTLKTYDKDTYFTSGDNADIKKEYVPMHITNETVVGNNKYTQYTIQKTDFLEALVDGFNLTGEQLKADKSLTVYLNNIFDTVKGSKDTVIKSSIYGYQEMLDAASWSATTQKYLKGYYNFQYTLYPCTYKVKYKIEDTDGKTLSGAENLDGVTLTNPISKKEVIYSEKVKYTLSDANKTVSNDKNKYTYQNWYYTYEDSDGSSKTKTPDGDIDFKAPDAEIDSDLVVHLVYKASTPIVSVTPIPTKPPTTVTPTPTIPAPTPEVVPESDSVSKSLTSAFTTGEIRADDRGSEKFIATAGVPTTESLYGQVTAKEYLLGYQLVKKVGKICYSVPVKKDYILKWKSATPGNAKDITETVTITQYKSVNRVYGYWEITNLEYYNINNAILGNYALPEGQLTLTPNSSYYNPPSISYYHTTDTNYHIIPPAEVANGITLASETITGGTSKPAIPIEDFTNEALTKTGKIQARSDSLVFGGVTVMSSQPSEVEAPMINKTALTDCSSYTKKNALYDNDQVIKATKSNGLYSSSGNIAYKAIAKIGSSNPDIANYAILGINDIVIHTPVLCDPIVTVDNDKYVQLISPTKDCVELVLDPDSNLNDFTLKISNTGFHTGIAGYFTRDFSQSYHDSKASYIAEENGLLRNEVKFPFDVFIDKGNDNQKSNDDYVKFGTWITLGTSTERFYVPTWTKEGVYTVDCRTVAVNVGDHIHDTETYSNKNRINYVATNTVKIEVSGRIYGLTLYDISDYPMWQEAFRIPKSSDLKRNYANKYPDGTESSTYNKNYSYSYTVGTNDQYGNDNGRNVKYTFPLVNGSHPFYKNQGILKTGYMFRFSLDTIGDMFGDEASVVVKPSFYFVDKNGKNRTAIDLYYTEEINNVSKNLVKVGGNIDKTNIKSYYTGDLNLGIPVSEMKATATSRNEKYGNFLWRNSPMFTFSKIWLNYAFRTLVGQNYSESIKKLDSFEDIQKSGVKEKDSDQSMQRWYGQYYIPNKVHAVKKGYDVMDYAGKHGVDYDEDFWLTDGYIIVNFNIYTMENENKHLSYINATNYQNNGNCSMWVMEGAPLSKSSYKGPKFDFFAGDFFIYYANKKMSDDYSSGAIY